jgi:hypothetical protein
MLASGKGSVLFVSIAVTLAALAMFFARDQRAVGQGGQAPVVGPRFAVIETQAHNLIVTDNRSNLLYFYTIDKDKDVGAELKLRGTIDLNDVGKQVIKPVASNPGN